MPLGTLNLNCFNDYYKSGGHDQIRTDVHGFAGRCVTTPPRGLN